MFDFYEFLVQGDVMDVKRIFIILNYLLHSANKKNFKILLGN